jgi:hypothetical protein
MIRTALSILALELIVIGSMRWRYGSATRRKLGDEPSHPATSRA